MLFKESYISKTFIVVLIVCLSIVVSYGDDSVITYEKSVDGTIIDVYNGICKGAVEILKKDDQIHVKKQKLKQYLKEYIIDVSDKDIEAIVNKYYIDQDETRIKNYMASIMQVHYIATIETSITNVLNSFDTEQDQAYKIQLILDKNGLNKDLSKYDILKDKQRFKDKGFELLLDIMAVYVENESQYSFIKHIVDEYNKGALTKVEMDTELALLLSIETDIISDIMCEDISDIDKINKLYNVVIDKKDSEYYTSMIESTTYDVIRLIKEQKYKLCTGSIQSLLNNNGIGYDFDNLTDTVIHIEEYKNYEYATREEAIEREIIEKIKINYDDDDIKVAADSINEILNHESYVIKYDEKDIYEDFLEIIYDYTIKDVKQYVVPQEIVDVFLKFDELGYKTTYRALVSHCRQVLKKSRVDEDILAAIQASKYDLEDMKVRISDVLDGDKTFYNYLNTSAIKDLIEKKPDNMDSIIVELVLDAMIESHKQSFVALDKKIPTFLIEGSTESKEDRIAEVLEKYEMDTQINAKDMSVRDTTSKNIYTSLRSKLADKKKSFVKVELVPEILKRIESLDDNKGKYKYINSAIEYIVEEEAELKDYANLQDVKKAYKAKDNKNELRRVLSDALANKIVDEINQLLKMKLETDELKSEINIKLRQYKLTGILSYEDVIQMSKESNFKELLHSKVKSTLGFNDL